LYGKVTGGSSIFAGSLGAVGEQMDAMGASIRGVTEDLQADHDALNTLTDDTFEARLAQSNLTDGLNAAATAATQSAIAAQALADVQQTLTDKALAAAAGMYDVESKRRWPPNEKYAAYTQTIKDGDATLSQLRQQQIDQAQGYADIAAKIAEEQGVEADSRAGIALQIAALEDMKAKYPLLADEIQRYIDKLNSIRDIRCTPTSPRPCTPARRRASARSASTPWAPTRPAPGSRWSASKARNWSTFAAVSP
jgi:uncharacterized phage infection (PIP) family protein YhgE